MMNAFLLEMKNDIERLKADKCETLIKVSCQELLIDRMKSDALRYKGEIEALRLEKKKLEETVVKYHQKEVTLTAERDTLKREVELVRESVKRTDVENGKLQGQLREEQNKRQKLRRAYGTLSKSFNGSSGEGEAIGDDEIRVALESLKEGLMV